jgi:hypothetical protein
MGDMMTRKRKYAVQILNWQGAPEYIHWDTISIWSNKRKAEKFMRRFEKKHGLEAYRVAKIRKVV